MPEVFANRLERGRDALATLDRALADGPPVPGRRRLHGGRRRGLRATGTAAPTRAPTRATFANVAAWLDRVEATPGFVNDLAPVPGARPGTADLEFHSVPGNARRLCRSTNADDPLSGLEVGERPEPEPPEGWTTVRSGPPRSTTTTCGRCGRRPARGPAADDPRLRRRRRRRGRQRGHRALGDRHRAGAATRRSTPSARCCPSATTARSRSGSPCRAATWCPSPPALIVRGGGLPADRLADRLPDAVRQGRAAARADRAGAGRRRRRGQRRDRARRARPALRVWVTSRAEEKRERALELGADAGLRERRAAARARRRRDGDRRRGHLGPLAAVAAPGRHASWSPARPAARLPSGRAQPGVLPAAPVVGSTMGTRDELGRLARLLVPSAACAR